MRNRIPTLITTVLSASLLCTVLAGVREVSPDQQRKATRVREQVAELSRMYLNLSMLSRIAPEKYRDRIDAKLSEMQQKAEEFRARYDEIWLNRDRLVRERQFETQLTQLGSDVSTYYAECRNSADELRRKLAIARRIPAAVKRTDAYLVGAARMVKQSGTDAEGFPGLRKAYEVQEDAKQALAAGELETAMRLTLRARDLIGETVKGALGEEDLASMRARAKEFWSVTNRMIQRAEKQVDKDANPRASKLLDMAKDHQREAREAFETGNPYVAMRHAQAARQTVSEISRFAARSQQADDRVERLELRLETARRIVDESGDPRAGKVLDKAEEHLDRARTLLAAGKPAAATTELDIAAKLGAKAFDMAKGGTAGKRMDREILKTSLIVHKAESVAHTDEQKSRASEAIGLVARARERSGMPTECLRLLDKATDIAFDILGQVRETHGADSTGDLSDEIGPTE